MTHPAILAATLARLIERARVDLATEGAAHRSLLAVLRPAYPHIESEVRLSDRDRIDLLVGDVGIEIKTQSPSRRAVAAQIRRYLTHDRVAALVLATSAPWPAQTTRIDGKTVIVASLSRGWL